MYFLVFAMSITDSVILFCFRACFIIRSKLPNLRERPHVPKVKRHTARPPAGQSRRREGRQESALN